MMMFLLFEPASTKWLGWHKDIKSRRDRQKTLKSKNKKHRIFLEYKVLPSCKVWAQTNKKCKSSSYLAIFCVLYAHRGLRPPLKRKISLFHVVVLVMAKNCTKKCDEHTELCFVYQTSAFLMFSLPSPSSDRDSLINFFYKETMPACNRTF